MMSTADDNNNLSHQSSTDAGITGEPCVTSQHFNSFQYKLVNSGNTRLAKRSSSIWYLLDKRDDGGEKSDEMRIKRGERKGSCLLPDPSPECGQQWIKMLFTDSTSRLNEQKLASLPQLNDVGSQWNSGISNCQVWIWLISGLFAWPVMMAVIQWSLIQTNNFGSLTREMMFSNGIKIVCCLHIFCWSNCLN